MGFSCDLEEGHGVRQFIRERRLVHVDTDTDNGLPDLEIINRILDQYASQFPVAVVQVVRPFDAHLVAQIMGSEITERGSHRHIEPESVMRIQEGRIKDIGDQQIQSRSTVPRILTLSSARFLQVCRYGSPFRQPAFTQQSRKVGIGGRHFPECDAVSACE